MGMGDIMGDTYRIVELPGCHVSLFDVRWPNIKGATQESDNVVPGSLAMSFTHSCEIHQLPNRIGVTGVDFERFCIVDDREFLLACRHIGLTEAVVGVR